MKLHRFSATDYYRMGELGLSEWRRVDPPIPNPRAEPGPEVDTGYNER
jgi:hypothetical protein